MKTLFISITALVLSFSALADQHLTSAEIRKIDVEAKKITLKHAPIKSLDMPAMTMVFQIKDSAVLEKSSGLKAGDKIMFSAQQIQGAFVVTQLEAMKEAKK
jgi:Cu(I)/Ag(I) efflux system periplasmic protein CusF